MQFNSLQRDLRTLYQVKDYVPRDEREQLGVQRLSGVSAKWTGEKRRPKAGEWYLSGAVVEAYQARADLATEYPIAVLVAEV